MPVKHNYFFNKKRLFFYTVLIVLFTTKQGFSQLVYQPYSYQFYQKLNTAEYSPGSALHTSLKPYFLIDSTAVRRVYDSLMMNNVDNTGKSWLNRVFFSGHVADVKRKTYTFYLDYLPDLQVGEDISGHPKQTTYLNTRGFQAGGTVNDYFFFYTSAYENQGKFANYITAYINKTQVVPSEIPVNGIPFATGTIDWTYVTSLIGYTPNKNITIALGEDKIFIGDGYRSMLLSDFAPVYPLLRFTANLGKHVQYTAIWAYMEDQNAPNFNSFVNNRRKWAAFHYIDWNITNRVSLGFFNAIINEEANNVGKLHGFDVNYIDPIYFSSSLGPANKVPDHTLFGFNGKYKVLNKTTVYGQLLFDQSAPTPNNANSISAWQAGFRGSDLFGLNGLNYIFEYNTAAPYVYSSQNPITNYAQLSEPLADPYGANFKEFLGIINYSIGRFDFQVEGDYAKLGLNLGTTNYGNDITLPNDINIPTVIGTTGQGLPTTVKYAEGTVAFVLNPKYNFRLELGGLLRQETNSQSDTKTIMVTFGLRSSFRDLYHDF